MKAGMNRGDMNRCKQYFDQGYTAEDISKFLNVDLEVVSKNCALYSKGITPKKKPVEMKTDQDVVLEKRNDNKRKDATKPKRAKPAGE